MTTETDNAKTETPDAVKTPSRDAAPSPAATAPASTPTKTPHSLQGNVISASADKTITVLIERKIKHPLYKKYIRRSSKVHAHDEKNQCKTGDTVIIESCRPLSKLKNWRLVEVIGTGA